MTAICCCCSSSDLSSIITPKHLFLSPSPSPYPSKGRIVSFPSRSFWKYPAFVVKASQVESSSEFANRMEKAWLISKQPRPVPCSSCESNGTVECKWCAGTGFFIIGNNMLCEVPSRNTTCLICAGKGSACCSDCKGTGFRAKWLGKPPPKDLPTDMYEFPT